MAGEHGARTDRGLGMSIVLGAVALAGVIAMGTAPGGIIAAAGFAVGVLAGLALILVVHLDV